MRVAAVVVALFAALAFADFDPDLPHKGSTLLEEITNDNFLKRVLLVEEPLMLLFYDPEQETTADAMEAFERAAEELHNIFRFGKVDVKKQRFLGIKYDVKETPHAKWFPRSKMSKKHPGDYKESMDTDSIVAFAVSKVGTNVVKIADKAAYDAWIATPQLHFLWVSKSEPEPPLYYRALSTSMPKIKFGHASASVGRACLGYEVAPHGPALLLVRENSFPITHEGPINHESATKFIVEKERENLKKIQEERQREHTARLEAEKSEL